MTNDLMPARERHLQDHYIYRVNALIEAGRDDLARQVVADARRELGTLAPGDAIEQPR